MLSIQTYGYLHMAICWQIKIITINYVFLTRLWQNKIYLDSGPIFIKGHCTRYSAFWSYPDKSGRTQCLIHDLSQGPNKHNGITR